jgi:hypothetical protein
MTIRRKTSVSMAVIGLVLSFVHSNGWSYLMKTKQAYRNAGISAPSWVKVELTGRKKSITGGPYELNVTYFEVSSVEGNEWVHSNEITVCEPEREVTYTDESLKWFVANNLV